MLVTLFGISVIIFVLLRIVPGNIVDILFAAAGYVDPADKANLERELGLDQPIVVQYLHWIGGLLHGDLGYSYVSEKAGARRDPAADSDHGAAGRAGADASPPRSAFPSASSARSSRARGSTISCASSA